MHAELAKWIYAYLERDEDIVVPVKKMWNEWHAIDAQLSLQEFTASVLADERFEAMGGVAHGEDMDWMEPDEFIEYLRDMEARGFYSGPRVKLKSREITLEHIARMVKKHNDQLEQALRLAREALPEEVSELEEGALIDIQVTVEKLRRELREAGLEPPDGEG